MFNEGEGDKIESRLPFKILTTLRCKLLFHIRSYATASMLICKSFSALLQLNYRIQHYEGKKSFNAFWLTVKRSARTVVKSTKQTSQLTCNF